MGRFGSSVDGGTGNSATLSTLEKFRPMRKCCVEGVRFDFLRTQNLGVKGALETKKIPTLFKRVFDDGGVVEVLPEVQEGLEWVLRGEGEATEKVDGAACAVIDGVLYKRFDTKNGKEPPKGAIPCQPQPDPYTGHWPHWVKVDTRLKSDKWFVRAWTNTPWIGERLADADGTYEVVGLHFQGNPYGLDDDFLERHGRIKIKDCPRTFDGIMEYLHTHEIEGIVWWKDGEPKCKIKRSDFGFKWPTDYWRADNG